MDLTKYHKSTEFPMFYSSKSGLGGVENISPSLSILRTLSVIKKPWFFNGFSTFWQNNSVIFIPFHYIPLKEKQIFCEKVPKR